MFLFTAELAQFYTGLFYAPIDKELSPKRSAGFFRTSSLEKQIERSRQNKKIYTIEPFVYADAQMSVQRLRELQSQNETNKTLTSTRIRSSSKPERGANPATKILSADKTIVNTKQCMGSPLG